MSSAPDGLAQSSEIAEVMTEVDGAIRRANRAAATLLNCHARHLRGRNLLIFFDGERASWSAEMTEALMGTTHTRIVRLRPRDRRAVEVMVTVAAANDAELRWTFEFAGCEPSTSPPSGGGRT